MVEANRTVPIPLDVPSGRETDLHHTHHHYQYCQQQTVEYCWPNRPKHPDDLCTSKTKAENARYGQLRTDTNERLHSNLVQKAIKDATSAIGSLKTSWENGNRISKPDFINHDDGQYAMTYDKRAATYSKHEATFATVNGTVTCRYILPAELEDTPYGDYILDSRWQFSTSKLVYRNGRFWLHAVVKRSFDETPVYPPRQRGSDMPEDTTRVLGVDLNVDGYTAVTSTGGFHGNADALNAYREDEEALRGELQQTGTRSAHLRFQAHRGTEWRHYDQYAHYVANEIKADALRVSATHVVFENLKHIRKRISNLPKFQQWLFGKVLEYTEYKLERYGVSVETVRAEHTSQACSHTDCDCVTGANRAGKEFACVECGYEVNADYNAAKNVGLRYLVEETERPASHTCSSGQATSQLALVSGTVSPTGVTASKDWPSTDKPHPQRASGSGARAK